jgi:hypothetical protein
VSNELPPAGWYADPASSSGQRFWDGEAWTSAAMSADGRPIASFDQEAPADPTPTAGAEPHPAEVVAVPPMAGSAPPPHLATSPSPGPSEPATVPAHTFSPSSQAHGGSPLWSAQGASSVAQPAATTANLGGRLRALPRGAWVGIGCIVLLAVLVAGRGTSTYDVDGTFELVDRDYLSVADGSGCRGYGGYGDIGSGLQVTVKDATGRLIASSALRSGRVEGTACVFPFRLTDITRSDYYTFEVGRRGDLTYSHAEMVANGWEAGFVLGDR